MTTKHLDMKLMDKVRLAGIALGLIAAASLLSEMVIRFMWVCHSAGMRM